MKSTGGIKRIFSILLRLICYPALLFVGAGIGTLIVLSVSGLCPRLDTGGVTCTTEAAKTMANFGFSVVLLTVFTGIPGLLAIGGVIFAIKDVLRLVRR